MTLSLYRIRLKIRALKRDHPMVSILEFTVNIAFSLAVLVLVTGGVYFLLQNIAPN